MVRPSLLTTLARAVTVPCLTGARYLASRETVAKWVPGGMMLLMAITTAVSARLTSAPPCISPAPCAYSLKRAW